MRASPGLRQLTPCPKLKWELAALFWTPTYDPAREPPHWTQLVRAGQYAVFVFDADTHVARDGEGLPVPSGQCASIALCDSLSEAVDLATKITASHPRLCGEIYDYEGMSKAPVQVVYNPAVRGKYEGLQFAKRQTLWGALAVLIGLAFIVHDVMLDLAWIWGYIIGVKLTLVGGFRMGSGILGWYEHRAESQLGARSDLRTLPS
jgi:hypothetical protein